MYFSRKEIFGKNSYFLFYYCFNNSMCNNLAIMAHMQIQFIEKKVLQTLMI